MRSITGAILILAACVLTFHRSKAFDNTAWLLVLLGAAYLTADWASSLRSILKSKKK